METYQMTAIQMPTFSHILGTFTDGNVQHLRLLQFPVLISATLVFTTSYLQLSDLRGDVPHQVLAQKIQPVWTDELRQRLQLCPQGDMNN